MSFPQLTELQHAVLAMIAARCAEKDIAAYLYLDGMQVRRLMSAACTRLDVKRRDQAVRVACEFGLIGPAGVVA